MPQAVWEFSMMEKEMILTRGAISAQGSGYWLSIGMLIDGKGNDRYRARRYSQGAGTHWAIGALIDFEGNDTYLSWGVSQGVGHDYSIGILWDGQGDDHYSSEWLSQGAGNGAGRGLLIDEQGNDIYEAGPDGTQGDGKYDGSRDEGSLGFLVDGGGKDIFSGTGREKKLWKSGRWGGGIDYKGRLPAIWKEPFQRDFSLHLPLSKAEDKGEEKGWSQFILPELEGPLPEETWGKTAEALAERGPSVIPALLKYLEIKHVVVRIILEDAFRKLGEKHLEDIHYFLQKDDTPVTKRRFLLYVLGNIANPESRRIFLQFLKDRDSTLQAAALRGLYKLDQTPSLDDAIRLSKSENRDVRRYLSLSLKTRPSPEAIPLLLGLMKDVDFNVRFAASEALKALGQ